MKKIDQIIVKKVLDESPDLSWIGEYTDQYNEWAIDVEQGEYVNILEQDEDYEIPARNRNYRFFVPYAGGEKPGTNDYQKYGKQDFEHMQKINNGEIGFIGIMAEARFLTSHDGKNWLINDISSGGLWGIEAPDNSSYHDEVISEELSALTDLLKELCFYDEEIAESFKHIKTIEEF